MTIAWTPAIISDMIAETVRAQQTEAADAEVDAEIEAFAKGVDAHSGLRETLGGASFMDAFEGRAGEKAERVASVLYKGFTSDAPWPASPQDIDDYVADVGEQTQELGLLASGLSMKDEVVEAELSADDKQRFALGGEEAIRNPLAGESLSDWARERQQQRAGLERLAAGREVEDEAETGPVVTIRGESYGDGPESDASMPRGFDGGEEFDPQDRAQDAARRAALMRETGEDLRTANEVAAGMKLPGEKTPAQPSQPQPSPPPPAESWPTPHF